MPDLAHWFGNDLAWSATGDLAVVSEPVSGEQSVLRRLLTGLGAYMWEPGYGAGLPGLVGTAATAASIQALVLAQIFLDPSVASTPAPTVSVTQSANGAFLCSISYVDAQTTQPVTLSFPVGTLPAEQVPSGAFSP